MFQAATHFSASYFYFSVSLVSDHSMCFWALISMKGNGPSLAVLESHLVLWDIRGNAFINNHSLLSNRLHSRLSCQVPVGKDRGPYLRVAGAAKEKHRTATDVTGTSPVPGRRAPSKHRWCKPSACSQLRRGHAEGWVTCHPLLGPSHSGLTLMVFPLWELFALTMSLNYYLYGNCKKYYKSWVWDLDTDTFEILT